MSGLVYWVRARFMLGQCHGEFVFLWMRIIYLFKKVCLLATVKGIIER